MAMIFAAGAALMVGGALWIWGWLIAGVSQGIHVSAGVGLFCASLVVVQFHREAVAAPWQMWMGLWAMMDDWLASLQEREDETFDSRRSAGPRRLRHDQERP